MNFLLILLFLLGANADLNSVLNSGRFYYRDGAALQGTSSRLADLNSVEAAASAAHPIYSGGHRHGPVAAVQDLEESRGWFNGPSLVYPSEDHSINMEDKLGLDWNNNHIRHFAPKNNCDQTEKMCLSFLNRLTETVIKRNATEMKEHFAASFHFKGCKNIHYLDDVVATISKIPAEKGVFAVFENGREYDQGHLVLNGTLYGIFARPIHAQLMIIKKSGTLLEAKDLDCVII